MKKSAINSKKACILTINGGSSSITWALFEVGESLRRILENRIEHQVP